MKTIRFKKTYKHTSTRTWEKGDTPTVSSALAAKLVKDKIAVYVDAPAPPLQVAAQNPATERNMGISAEEWEKLNENAEAAAKASGDKE